MFLALKEIKHEKIRYGLIIAMVVLVSYLIFILTSLALGLAHQNTAALETWDFKRIVLNKDADVNLRQSLLSNQQIKDMKLGSNEAILGQASIVVKQKGAKKVAANFLGVKKDEFIYKNLVLTSGRMPKKANEIVVDDTLKNKGYALNDKVLLNSLPQKFTIVGFTSDSELNISPGVYGLLPTWQALKSISPQFVASAVLSKSNSFKPSVNGVASYSEKTFTQKLPGYEAQNATFSFMIGFLMVISLIVIAVFLYIITIQKLPNYAVLRAQGMPASFLVKATLFQALILVFSGLVIGVALTLLTAYFLPEAVPVSFNIPLLGLVALGLLITSSLGALLPVKTILKVDPVKVIGG